ncbi:hypothetical protein, partial [Flavobacterium sp.]|uniref:hypothetical protein n=1 Tax=Flavobacterium sp. TaxID=239 RepID=UPI002C4162BE
KPTKLMRKFKTSSFLKQIMIMLFAFTLSNCSVGIGTSHSAPKTKKVPPGQAKKMTGQKSARNYAPGHNK